MTKVLRSSHQNLARAVSFTCRSWVVSCRAHHSADGYSRKHRLIVSTFSQLSRHSCAYRFLVDMSTISR